MQGIVTGASRGLGLALTRELVARGWQLVVDARDTEPLERAVAGLEGVVWLAGDVADPDHRARARRGGGRADRPPRQQREHARPHSAPRAGGVSARRAPPRLRGQRARPAGSRPARASSLAPQALASSTSAPTPRSSPTSSWGGYGSSKAALVAADARFSAPRTRSCASTPSTPGTCARRCSRTHSRARTSPTGRRPRTSVPGFLTLIEGDVPSGTLSRSRPRPRSRCEHARACELPARLEADAPAEARGRARDDVRLLVATRRRRHRPHAASATLPRFLEPGDLLVVNTSATLPAALRATRADGCDARAPPLDPGARTRSRSVLERGAALGETGRSAPPEVGERLALPDGASATILGAALAVPASGSRACELPRPLDRIPRVSTDARSATATCVAPGRSPRTRTCTRDEPGSAEMPSAGRPFTAGADHAARRPRRRSSRRSSLHTGVSSQERDERPYPERYRVPASTARLVNAVHGWGGRVIAVGTTVVRALETAADARRRRRAAGEGWTEPRRSPPSADCGRSTDCSPGWHEPESSHLDLLARGRRRRAARAELPAKRSTTATCWHEFGDSHLILTT